MKYLVFQGTTMLGVAEYLDEAKEFAERVSVLPAPTWTNDGLMYTNNVPSGWRVVRHIPSSVG